MHEAAVAASVHPSAAANDAPLCCAADSGVEMHEPLWMTARSNSPRTLGEVMSAHTE